MQNKSIYKVYYPDVNTEQLTVNIIAENMLPQVESKGHHYQIITEIIDHKRDGRKINKMNGSTKSSNGNLHQKR